ncbi:DUF5752 family protein [Nitrospinae bacterium AH_259_B05_G02_I21]|nr:DUF5752 family protein [Nitrospinae bacterium AH_259_B05_G02_I21]
MKKTTTTKAKKKRVKGLAPFAFVGCVEIKEMLGRRVRDEQELLDNIEEVPPESIYFHTQSYFLRHRYIKGPYPNDFATWTAQEVGDNVLGERLGILNPFAFESVEALRSEIISIIDDHLKALKVVPRVVHGEPFEFMSSRIIEIPTGIEVETFEDFASALKDVDVSVIYFHVFEAELRMGKGHSDFAIWLETSVGQGALAERLDAIDPYLLSLEELRAQILERCHEALDGKRT